MDTIGMGAQYTGGANQPRLEREALGWDRASHSSFEYDLRAKRVHLAKGKAVSTHWVVAEGMLFRIMLQPRTRRICSRCGSASL